MLDSALFEDFTRQVAARIIEHHWRQHRAHKRAAQQSAGQRLQQLVSQALQQPEVQQQKGLTTLDYEDHPDSAGQPCSHMEQARQPAAGMCAAQGLAAAEPVRAASTAACDRHAAEGAVAACAGTSSADPPAEEASDAAASLSSGAGWEEEDVVAMLNSKQPQPQACRGHMQAAARSGQHQAPVRGGPTHQQACVPTAAANRSPNSFADTNSIGPVGTGLHLASMLPQPPPSHPSDGRSENTSPNKPSWQGSLPEKRSLPEQAPVPRQPVQQLQPPAADAAAEAEQLRRRAKKQHLRQHAGLEDRHGVQAAAGLAQEKMAGILIFLDSLEAQVQCRACPAAA